MKKIIDIDAENVISVAEAAKNYPLIAYIEDGNVFMLKHFKEGWCFIDIFEEDITDIHPDAIKSTKIDAIKFGIEEVREGCFDIDIKAFSYEWEFVQWISQETA